MSAPLRAYMAHAGNQHEAAVLVFADSNSTARRIALGQFKEWFDGVVYRDMRAHLTTARTVTSLLDQTRTEPYLFDSTQLPCCKSCEQWGMELGEDGLCEQCREDGEP